MFRYSFSYSNLSSSAIGAHLHDSSLDGECSGSSTLKTFPIEGSTSGFVNGSVSLDAVETAALFAGDLFFDIHTAANADGEIAGKKTKDPKKTPTVSQWGLMGLTLLLMTAGTLVIARGSRRFAT